MAAAESTPVQVLFREWRGGDAASGQEMAQRFSDWYYAITVARLGDTQGRAPLQQACEEFARSIVMVNNSAKLAEWAHSLISDELKRVGARHPGGDFPNALTQRRSPTEILRNALTTLPGSKVRLLAHAYGGTFSQQDLIAEAEQNGGFPFAILEARRDLKRWLVDHQNIPFQVVPDEIDRDASPLPLYEAGRLVSTKEEELFERWMLDRFELCRDIAEFAPFSLAIRAGALDLPEAPAEPIAPIRKGTGLSRHRKILYAEMALLVMLIAALAILLILRAGA